MTQKGLTKDELLIIKLYQMALKSENLQQAFDCHVLGRAISQNDRGTQTIIRHLAQANFVKKTGDNSIYLTEQGLALAKSLL